jgi:hypothetical protein
LPPEVTMIAAARSSAGSDSWMSTMRMISESSQPPA